MARQGSTDPYTNATQPSEHRAALSAIGDTAAGYVGAGVNFGNSLMGLADEAAGALTAFGSALGIGDVEGESIPEAYRRGQQSGQNLIDTVQQDPLLSGNPTQMDLVNHPIDTITENLNPANWGPATIGNVMALAALGPLAPETATGRIAFNTGMGALSSAGNTRPSDNTFREMGSNALAGGAVGFLGGAAGEGIAAAPGAVRSVRSSVARNANKLGKRMVPVEAAREAVYHGISPTEYYGPMLRTGQDTGMGLASAQASLLADGAASNRLRPILNRAQINKDISNPQAPGNAVTPMREIEGHFADAEIANNEAVASAALENMRKQYADAVTAGPRQLPPPADWVPSSTPQLTPRQTPVITPAPIRPPTPPRTGAMYMINRRFSLMDYYPPRTPPVTPKEFEAWMRSGTGGIPEAPFHERIRSNPNAFSRARGPDPDVQSRAQPGATYPEPVQGYIEEPMPRPPNKHQVLMDADYGPPQVDTSGLFGLPDGMDFVSAREAWLNMPSSNPAYGPLASRIRSAVVEEMGQEAADTFTHNMWRLRGARLRGEGISRESMAMVESRPDTTMYSAVSNQARKLANPVTSSLINKVGSMLRRQGQTPLGPYHPMLDAAARRGQQALSNAIFLEAQRNPDFRVILTEIQEDQQ